MRLLLELPLDSAPLGVPFGAADDRRRLPPFGDWRLATWLSEITWQWNVVDEAGRRVLEHPTIFTSCLRSGDGSWGDFTLEFDVRQLLPNADTSMDDISNVKGRTGVMFRYQTFRRTYALFLECQERVVLYKRVERDWIPLAQHEISIDRARYYGLKVECDGDHIRCFVDGEPLFDVTDSTYRRGRVAIYANTLSRYGSVRVTATDEQIAEMDRFRQCERRIAAESAEGLARPVLWGQITSPPKSGCLAPTLGPRGELAGQIAISSDATYAPRDGKALLGAEIDGGVRWSLPVTRPFPRVWDLDGDGRQEVVLYDGPVLKLLDAETGALKAEAPTPPCNRVGNRGGREDQLPYVPIYMMFPANVRGLGPGRDMLIFDLYTGVWVFDDKLNLIWWRNCEHGHDIGLYDIDGDGCDEVLCGFTMFDHDGTKLWTMDGFDYLVSVFDHVDHIAIGEFDGDPGTGLEIGLTCGNAGFYLLDQEGAVRAHHRVGHAQSLQVGEFRPDLPGSQFLAGCRWGNPGTRVLFSGAGERLWTIEPDNSYASDVPARWTADRDLFLAISTPEAAGFYDGHGRRVIDFPDGHLCTSDRPYCAYDFTGNGLEDVVVADACGMRIYTQENGPPPDSVPRSARPSRFAT